MCVPLGTRRVQLYVHADDARDLVVGTLERSSRYDRRTLERRCTSVSVCKGV